MGLFCKNITSGCKNIMCSGLPCSTKSHTENDNCLAVEIPFLYTYKYGSSGPHVFTYLGPNDALGFRVLTISLDNPGWSEYIVHCKIMTFNKRFWYVHNLSDKDSSYNLNSSINRKSAKNVTLGCMQ